MADSNKFLMVDSVVKTMQAGQSVSGVFFELLNLSVFPLACVSHGVRIVVSLQDGEDPNQHPQFLLAIHEVFLQRALCFLSKTTDSFPV